MFKYYELCYDIKKYIILYLGWQLELLTLNKIKYPCESKIWVNIHFLVI